MHISFPRRLQAVCLLLLAMLAASCSTMRTGAVPALDANAQWALLPFTNHTETPQAGLRAEAITEGLLRAGGIARLKRYPANLNTETLFEPMDRKQADAARAWAQSEGVRYALTGSVDEWRYKVGVDGEPAAGVTLQLIDLQRDEVVWSATGGRTGWSREALSAIAHKLIANLVDPLLARR
ncbi:MAG TPA: penicillin-binding protein activator LpoB [Noviherbaspirillum sp.]|jgi:TolB-like protein|uniref:penicillin-binding protein activator LpoB n=1 Tax=Noviherbaspirillum sp. TaxID=1926288 RepID=UPI002F91F1F1